ncbi:MAG: DivIVA domain-containing protein [Bacteroidetes bacterium]|nr:DivIVA domain-containing protein [Bacteroidota bacterium]
MENKKIHYYFTPALLGILMFASNFLNTNLFKFGDNNFSVWFVLSVMCFACGWFISKTLGWRYGGKVVFAMIIAVTIISVLMISFFRDYFAANELLTENLILYSLRDITLGAMAFFGMSVVEILTYQRDSLVLKERLKTYEDLVRDAKKEAELEIREAKVTAQKIINDAELTAKNTVLKKERIEKELKEFIQAEKELIKRYENIG